MPRRSATLATVSPDRETTTSYPSYAIFPDASAAEILPSATRLVADVAMRESDSVDLHPGITTSASIAVTTAQQSAFVVR